MTRMKTEVAGKIILRLGLAALFLWFGFSQIFDGLHWVSWVPAWAVSFFHLPPAMLVLLNGAFEVIAGGMFALGIFVRPVALLLGGHLALIIFGIGLNAIGVRDFGLMMATFALMLLGPDDYCVMR